MGRIFGKFIGAGFIEETPSGTINGSNVTFTLANTPASSAAVNLILDSLVLPGTDYSISGTTITLGFAPVVPQKLKAKYVKAK